MSESATIDHLPSFIVEPGAPDSLYVFVIILLLLLAFGLGAIYFTLHSLPERMAHRRSPGQMQLVAILCLVGLFTHEFLFWIAALLLAAVDLPDLVTPLRRIAGSLESLAGRSEDEAQTEERKDHV
ncbi:MAG: hypothetical protein AAFS03_07025 [Pseudomonadota bacterium]